MTWLSVDYFILDTWVLFALGTIVEGAVGLGWSICLETW